jgi:hypothetical protein
MKRGHRLSTIEDFPSDIAAHLATFSIATAEEFLAQAHTEREALREALDVSSTDFDRAVSIATTAAGEEYVDSLKALDSAPEYGYGALSPTSPEFNQYVQQGEGKRRDDDQERDTAGGNGDSR